MLANVDSRALWKHQPFVEVSVEYTLSLVVGLVGIAISAVLFAGHIVA